MANTILLKKNGTASVVPTSLSFGELALNYADGKLYYKHADTTIKEITGGSGGITYTRHTANVTAVDRQGIIADTSGGQFTVTLPATPTTGAQVIIVDGANWGTTNLIVARNGSTIESIADDISLDIAGMSATFIYDGTTWEIYSQIGAAGGNAITNVSGTAPIVSSGGTAPVISISAATTSAAGSMSSVDKTKLDGIATGATANTGTVTSVSATVPSFLSISGSPVTGSGTLAFTYSGTALPVANGGTGTTTLASNNVLLGNGTGALQVVAPGTSGNVLTSNGTTWSSTAPAGGGITYTKYTTNVTAVDKQGIIADTSGGQFTVTLPATPATGVQVVIVDGASWGTTNLIVARNGSTIEGVADDVSLDITGMSASFIYDGTTWEIYAQVGANGGTVATLAGIETLTNKTIDAVNNTIKTNESMAVAVSDEITAITTGTSKITFRAPFAMTLYQLPRASLSTASTSGVPAIDINVGGVSIFSTVLTIDANEKTSTTAVTAAVLSTTSIADDAEITVDIDTAGTGAKGLKIILYYRRT